MAHCRSPLVHRPYKNGHNENLQDLLPPRKRLLVGLKQAVVTPASTSSTFSPSRAESLSMEVHVDSTHSSPALLNCLLLHSPNQKCFSCGDGGVLLHRVPCLGGSSSYYCSFCVLASNRNMYCVLCYQVIENSSPSSSSSTSSLSLSSGLLTCCRCQRLTHLDCALKLWSPSLEGVSLTLCRDCYTRNNGQFREALSKDQKIGSARRFKEAVTSCDAIKLPIVDMQELAAARIVAMTAKKAALEAKQKAESLAKAAARAAMHARAILDNVYTLSQHETDNNGDSDVGNVGHKEDEAISAPKFPKTLKKRALSAIVASEMLSKRPNAARNHMARKDLRERKPTRTKFESEFAKATPFTPDSVVEEYGRRASPRTEFAVKRKKTLSSFGLQNPTKTHKLAALKSLKLNSEKTRKPSLLSKGKLGAIVSQVLASNKLSKSRVNAPSCKARVSGLHCETLNDAVENSFKKKKQSVDLVTLENDRLLDESLPILRGSITGPDACKPAHHGVFF